MGCDRGEPAGQCFRRLQRAEPGGSPAAESDVHHRYAAGQRMQLRHEQLHFSARRGVSAKLHALVESCHSQACLNIRISRAAVYSNPALSTQSQAGSGRLADARVRT